MNFKCLGLHDSSISTLKTLSIVNPTKIQEVCIPKIFEGKDILASAKTGSGKTAAFALPILQHLSTDPYGTFSLILTPTRYLLKYCFLYLKKLFNGGLV